MRVALCLVALSATLAAAQPGPVVFSEIMWSGSTSSSADEWIELYNRTNSEVDLSGWTICRVSSGAAEPMLQIPAGRLGPGAVFLIANYAAKDAHSLLAVQPDLVDADVALPNTQLQLRLYDGDPGAGAHLIDVADDGTGAPAAGDASLKRAMTRVVLDGDGVDKASWATATAASGWDPGAAELGTPGTAPGAVSTGPRSDTAVGIAGWAWLKAGR